MSMARVRAVPLSSRPHCAVGGAWSTNPANAGALCGRHDRWKTRGYTTWRDPTGRWHTSRPDGTEIVAA